MATNRMLIDASHPEETRVVVQRGNRIDEFDFESASRKQLRGNIYLAKVTRVEPSLQAAFVEYGGNRHGFLAFSEIHPDYYQIPIADRQALLEEEARFAESQEEDEGDASQKNAGRRGKRRRSSKPRTAENGETVSEDVSDEATDAPVVASADAEPESSHEQSSSHHDDVDDAERDQEQDQVEVVGGADILEDVHEQRSTFRPRKQYKIQEVIKRRQILLVQVVKEERGNKGAALTTYLSLAGRYSVLMPNTARGGGVSRKITNSADRKRLKELATDLEVPDGMGVILRTAGASRTKPEIKRDFEYLLRVWEQVRETTLQSVAPMLVYEEGSLIKRSLRDLFGKEVEEVLVSGEAGYKEARDFMKMLMPSQVKAIKAHREPQPLFARYGVDSQLDAMFTTNVTLKSGGYIVINPTEALVSIDVNSGRSTREHNIEDTAVKTNIEAAEEVARQVRLRDLAGLIVIDFIDMEEHRNNRTVEKKLKDCLKNDRARIQVGRISAFGLMEMSRQRMRTGVLESSTIVCSHCGGSGFVRATSSVALLILRGIEEALLKSAQFHLNVKTRTDVAFYILNQKRLTLRDIEMRFGVTITLMADDSLHGTDYYTVERGEPAPEGGLRIDTTPVVVDDPDDDFVYEEVEETEESAETSSAASDTEADTSSDGADEDAGAPRGRRRRRRGRGRDREPREDRPQGASASDVSTDADSGAEDAEDDNASDSESTEPGSDGQNADRDGRRRRRRGRRGGRRNRAEGEAPRGDAVAADSEGGAAVHMTEEAVEEQPIPVVVQAPVVEEVSAPKKRSRKKAGDEVLEAPVAVLATDEKPKRGRAKKVVVEVAIEPVAVAAIEPPAPIKEAVLSPKVVPVIVPEPEPEPEDPSRPKRTGWWSKAKKAMGGE